jgi:hypothetical protein
MKIERTNLNKFPFESPRARWPNRIRIPNPSSRFMLESARKRWPYQACRLQNILKKLTKENFSAQYKNKQRLQYLRIQFPSRFCVGSAIIGDPSKQFISIQPKNFLAHYNSICNGRITSGYKFRRDLRRIRQNWPSNQTIHLNASKKNFSIKWQ